MRILFIRLPALLLALVLVVLAVNNRTFTLLHLPVTDLTVGMPLYAIFFGGMFFGVILTALVLTPPRLRGFIARRRAEKRAERSEHLLADSPGTSAEKKALMMGAIDKAQVPGQATPPAKT